MFSLSTRQNREEEKKLSNRPIDISEGKEEEIS